MTCIETSIRKAIIRAHADNPEKRNKVYLAARDTIYRLQPGNNKQAMEQLAAAVRTIEQECAVRELTYSQRQSTPAQVHGANLDQPDPFTEAMSDMVGADRALEEHNPNSIPWLAIGMAAVVIAILSGSTVLLWSQFQ